MSGIRSGNLLPGREESFSSPDVWRGLRSAAACTLPPAPPPFPLKACLLFLFYLCVEERRGAKCDAETYPVTHFPPNCMWKGRRGGGKDGKGMREGKRREAGGARRMSCSWEGKHIIRIPGWREHHLERKIWGGKNHHWRVKGSRS